MGRLISACAVMVLIVGTGLATAASADTIYVDDDAPNDPAPGHPAVSDPLEDGSADHPFDAIQEGINAAGNGDTVLVLDGTYIGDGNRDLDFGGKLITVRSENGPDNCLIDCENSGRGFHFHSGEGPGAVVEGLTITAGYAGGDWPENCGGAIYCESSSSPTISNCTISGNSASSYGGGVHCGADSSPTITNCTISGNSSDHGGGVYSLVSSPTITNCTITANTAYDKGGGVRCWEASPTLTNCTISDNSADYGGGVYCRYSSPTVTNCTISDNSSDRGGGIYCYDSSPTMTNCMISGNSGSSYGGGIYCYDTSSTITNCTISDNSSDRGGGIFCYWYSSLTVTNCTISDNSSDRGGGIYSEYSTVTLSNCILWGDVPDEIDVASGDVAVTYSDVQGGWPGQGNIDADPLFVDPNNDDCHIGAASPCIDAADNEAVPADTLDLDGDGDTDEPIPFDLNGNPRFVDDPDTEDTGNGTPPIVDMGAYEFQVGVVAHLDIKPGSCPNPLNRNSHGKLPVAIVGTAEFDVTQIDVDTLVLARADGVGGSVMPLMGPPGPGIHVEDVATPFEGEPCDCHELGGDGIDDLSMKFDTEFLVAELELNDLPGGEMVELVVSGALSDGTPFSVSDCIRLVPPGSGGGLSRLAASDDGRDVSPESRGALSPESFSRGDSPQQDADQASGDADANEESQGAFNAPIAPCGAISPAFLLAPIAALGLMRCRRP